jgi:hypothetical protein
MNLDTAARPATHEDKHSSVEAKADSEDIAERTRKGEVPTSLKRVQGSSVNGVQNCEENRASERK